ETLGNFIAVLIYNTESTNGGALQLGISTSPRPIPPPIRRSGRYPKRKHVNYGKSDTCQTRSSMSMECPSPCISTCTNQAISRGAFFDSNHLQVTTFGGKKGTSIVAQSLIKEETLVIEYTGKRSLTIDKGSSMKYMLQFKGGHIDGATDGNKPRFLNHSCDPNLGVAEWK
ncbi:histone-lysine N-methyltransferase, partial [Parastagonospora nodorum]